MIALVSNHDLTPIYKNGQVIAYSGGGYYIGVIDKPGADQGRVNYTITNTPPAPGSVVYLAPGGTGLPAGSYIVSGNGRNPYGGYSDVVVWQGDLGALNSGTLTDAKTSAQNGYQTLSINNTLQAKANAELNAQILQNNLIKSPTLNFQGAIAGAPVAPKQTIWSK